MWTGRKQSLCPGCTTALSFSLRIVQQIIEITHNISVFFLWLVHQTLKSSNNGEFKQMTWKLIKYYNQAKGAGETLCVAFALTHKAVLPESKLQRTIFSSQTENATIFLIVSSTWIFCHFVGSNHKVAFPLLTTSCIKLAILLFKQWWNCRGKGINYLE